MIITEKEKFAVRVLDRFFDFNVKWRVINVITVQSVVVLNMNTEVFRIYDMNTLNKIGDLKYNGKYFM